MTIVTTKTKGTEDECYIKRRWKTIANKVGIEKYNSFKRSYIYLHMFISQLIMYVINHIELVIWLS